MKLESKLVDKKPYMASHINLKVSLLEVKDGTSNQLIKKELETLLTERFTHFFTKIQAKEADILGLGQYYRNQLLEKIWSIGDPFTILICRWIFTFIQSFKMKAILSHCRK
ncbi:Ger(x)C family spore germination C-terminal domain-containing protein [Paenibacillus sp. FSL H7-0331]|uniref:Ger(x)C family spore germination C-terminal domain-containing protein n=1 Tax=Paenibacillus sp. FSL H7-0331 TaxID=1920421 RepID=UPI0021166C63|nr:Ger(x)C family spore germination C-terminal domain-containing protein [Paenibacillus sp. FSL H7-0331]